MRTMVPVGADALWAEDSKGAGPALVLLHSGISDARLWDPVWPELTADFRVIRYDSRGFGRSPAATEPFTELGDLRAVLDHFGVDRPHLAGCSQGGGTAAELALADPGRVPSLVLLCPGFTGYRWPPEPDFEASESALRAAGDEDGLLRLWLGRWAAAGAGPFVADLMRAGLAAESSEALCRTDESVFGRLGDLTVPALIMVGDRDTPALIASNVQAAERIPRATLIRMPGVDHYPPVRDPAAVIAAIRTHGREPGPVRIRDAGPGDREFLADMLVEAVNWSPRWNQGRASIFATPAIAHYVSGWPRDGDLGVLAEADGQPAGAAWLRFWSAGDPGYGFVAPDVPELTIGVAPLWRGRGVGRALLRALAGRAREQGIARISLSVERKNYARELYRAEGYRVVDSSDRHSDTMIKTLCDTDAMSDTDSSTGTDSSIVTGAAPDILHELEQTLVSRRELRPEGSYSAELFANHERLMRKVMEEAFEVCLELGRAEVNADLVAAEAADLLYHLMAGLVSVDVPLDRVLGVLAGRRR
jgi:3-oxoadipate enol-lactonase